MTTVPIGCSIVGGLIINPVSQGGETVVLNGPAPYLINPGTPGIAAGYCAFRSNVITQSGDRDQLEAMV